MPPNQPPPPPNPNIPICIQLGIRNWCLKIKGVLLVTLLKKAKYIWVRKVIFWKIWMPHPNLSNLIDSLIVHLETNIQCPNALSPFSQKKVKRTSVWKKHLNFRPFSFITIEGQPNRNCEKKPGGLKLFFLSNYRISYSFNKGNRTSKSCCHI